MVVVVLYTVNETKQSECRVIRHLDRHAIHELLVFHRYTERPREPAHKMERYITKARWMIKKRRNAEHSATPSPEDGHKWKYRHPASYMIPTTSVHTTTSTKETKRQKRHSSYIQGRYDDVSGTSCCPRMKKKEWRISLTDDDDTDDESIGARARARAPSTQNHNYTGITNTNPRKLVGILFQSADNAFNTS